VTAPADWLPGERPPLPHRIKPESEPYVGRHRAKDWDDTDFIPSPVPRQCVPGWPEIDLDGEALTVEFAAVKPRRWSLRWLRDNLTWKRQVAGGLSGLVLLASAWGWWQ
jgi:hypothetical protein